MFFPKPPQPPILTPPPDPAEAMRQYLFENALDELRQKRLAHRAPPRYPPGTLVRLDDHPVTREMERFILMQRADWDEQHWAVFNHGEGIYVFEFGLQKQMGSTWRSPHV